jgi:hypothetical protein
MVGGPTVVRASLRPRGAANYNNRFPARCTRWNAAAGMPAEK